MGDTNAPLMILRISVLGAVGVGKSTVRVLCQVMLCGLIFTYLYQFIGAAGTIKAAPKIHLEPEPPRAAVEEFELKSNHERTVSLVDTPGFNYPGSHDSTVLDDIIEFLKAKLRPVSFAQFYACLLTLGCRKSPDQKVGGIIYLLDASSQTRAQYSADNMQPPPLLVLATAHPEHDSDKPISEAVKAR
ncbi:hypothetical protein D9619_013618 [Psilocybe cf. subviscida]|uniref:Uncharacterized protein n=1 Tax=Psilocybe cf. subviscida TaxID=2480587 RepID=A0A8H5BS50_9AGAR|nr:hypothetical protein D9619_013618 [Psilocybe cf. subviscida]